MGLDAHQIINERERYLEARYPPMNPRAWINASNNGSFDTTIDVTQDENVKGDKENDSTVSTPLDALKPYSALIHPSNTAHGKIRALIELKALRVVDKQHAMRAQVAERLSHSTITAGTGLFSGPENGWEIHWSLLKFPNHLHKGTIV